MEGNGCFSSGFARYFLIWSRNLGFHPAVWNNMSCSSSACWTKAWDLSPSPHSQFTLPLLSPHGHFSQCSLPSPSLHQWKGQLIMMVRRSGWCWGFNTTLLFYSWLVQVWSHWPSKHQWLEYVSWSPLAFLLGSSYWKDSTSCSLKLFSEENQSTVRGDGQGRVSLQSSLLIETKTIILIHCRAEQMAH